MPRKREDLTGRKFGKLTVIGYDRTNRNGDSYWLCKCDCGNPKIVSVIRTSLTSSSTKSCGCIAHEPENLLGNRYGSLTVIEYTGRDQEFKARWKCLCDCGTELIVDVWNLKSGHTKSCGCLGRNRLGDINRTHGHSQTGESIYPVWKSMKARCNNPNNQAYHNYGGRGITVCKEWDEDFQAFYGWSMKNGYDPDLTIDRVDNDKGYYPENCRWATRLEQANNKRSCKYITYNDETRTIAEWSRIFNVNYSAFMSRVKRGDMRDFEDYFGGKEYG